MRGILSRGNWRKVGPLLQDHRLPQIWNTLRYAYHAWRGFPTVRAPYSPVWLMLSIIGRCNLQCQHCPYFNPCSPALPPPSRDMSLDTYQRILDRYPAAIAVSLGGGEPFLHPDIFEMIRLAHERRMKVHIPTNGTLLPHCLRAVVEAPVELLNVSLYGTDSDSFREVAGAKGSLFEDTLRAMEEILKQRPRSGYPRTLRASFICSKHNLDRVVEFVRLCETIGVDQVKLKNLHNFGIPGFDDSACLHEQDPEVQRLFALLRRERFRIPVFLPRLPPTVRRLPGCTMPFRTLTVGWNGAIGPCCVQGPQENWGNVFSSREAWNGPHLLEVRNGLLDPNSRLPAGCLNCEEMVNERVCVGGDSNHHHA